MNILKIIRDRQAARDIKDVEIPDASWKPDFDLADRYQNFANELMRIALLGIAGYGFLLKEVYMKEAKFFSMIVDTANYIIVGSISLGLSLTLVLAHRFVSTSCLYYQILIMRGLTRIGNSNWTDKEKEDENHFLSKARKAQRKKSRLSHHILVTACIFFALGFLFVIVVFYKFFHDFPKK
jgi:hypothetical protein